MPPTIPSEHDEAAFMKELLGDLDDSFWNAVPSPNPSPVKPLPSQRPSGFPTTPTKRRPLLPENPLPAPRTSPSKLFSAGELDMASFLEGAEDWDLEMNADPLTPKKEAARKPNQPSIMAALPLASQVPGRGACTRCIVESISELDTDGRFQKNLLVKLDPGEERRSVVLRDDWTATDVRVGDVINVLGTFTLISPSSSSVTLSITITSKANLLILHPDLLLTATALSNAPQCRRKPILSSLVRSTSDFTPALVWGNMLHEVMQTCFNEGRWEEAWIHDRIDEVVRGGLTELLRININVDQAIREVQMRAKGLHAFSDRYLSDAPKETAVLTNTRSVSDKPSLLAVSELLDVEEDIWSPTYGLKGKIDATVQTIISDPNPPFMHRTVTAGPQPFEIKTGRAVAGMEHRAQTMLYTLLVAERYGVEVPSGLLYYTQSEEVVRVPASRNELRGLLVARNEMAGYMMRRHQKSQDRGGAKQVPEGESPEIDDEPFLPPTIDDERACKRCYALDTCMLYRKAVENVLDTSSPIADTYDLKTSHLTKAQSSFFKKWEALISLEEQDLIRFKKELWTMGAFEREAKGRCFGSMTIDASYCPPTLTTPAKTSKIHRFTYKFIRARDGAGATRSLLNGHLDSGDAITISVEPDLLALARGFIVNLSPAEVVVGVDHELCLDAIARRLTLSDLVPQPTPPGAPIIFRIDKDELFGGMGRIRDNLAQMFYAEGDSRRLRLVVDLKPPVFDAALAPAQLPAAIAPHCAHLNDSQKHAVGKVLAAEDYALILGMPGTGKTTVIAAIIKSLVSMGKTVLLTSYTHSAVDTILSKLTDADFGILRVGNVDKIHPDVHRFTLAARRTPTTIEQLELQVMTPPVVATTCLSIDHALFARRKFDYCIVDEASQITLPTCVGPLRFADKFVLVGDHFQLPPLVRNRDAKKGGLDISLFRRLSDAHPHAVVDMGYQYRMNEDIMLLSNKLIYGDRLRCGSELVANRSLVLPDRTFLRGLHGGKLTCHSKGCWIETLMSESCKAVFVDTDNLPARDSRVGDLVQNEVEASLVRQVAETLIRSGVEEDQIGIISLYRQQIKLLSNLLQDRKGIEILTADRSQGRDKDCIIISLVRSNDSGHIGDLVKDWRRMNVSFTRARSKLVIFGSRKTLQESPLLAEFFDLMASRNWIVHLPPDADAFHARALDPDGLGPVIKRPADEMEPLIAGPDADGPQKKAKKSIPGGGVLRGRPILRDLVVNEA